MSWSPEKLAVAPAAHQQICSIQAVGSRAALPDHDDVPRELPSGRVTFLFTDVEGSTNLLHELGAAAYAEALIEHRRVLREALTRHGGVEVDTQGDAIFVVFPSPSGAVRAAAEAQEALADGPIRVRMGVHTGQPVVTHGHYVGLDVHKAARIAAAAHGDQVVVSRETRLLLTDDVPLTDLGEHRVKDFPQPVWIFQLGVEHFPPLRTISNTNLPRPASSFIGREREVGEVGGRLRGGARLLTLTGPGGSGKSRLAIEVAASLVPEHRNGVFWVGLAAVREPALVTETIGQTLGAKDPLPEHIGEREMLLVLDNFEQVVQAAPGLQVLLEACPNLRLLVTSRELLRVSGEVEYPVPPLGDAEAVELFSARSRIEPDETVAELCRRLDNLPLAVELAAARAAVLSPAQIMERLSQRLDLLKGGRDADARQQTLRATIAWSHDLLSSDEQRLFARLSVFRGGSTLESAEEVAGADVDLVQSLVDKSLFRRTDDRFRMLETIREYAAERLAQAGEETELKRRHAHHVLELVERSEPLLHGTEQTSWLNRLASETDNVRGALEWSLEHEPEAALRLAAAASWFWQMRSRLGEGRTWVETALATAPDAALLVRARALDGAGRLAYYASDFAASREFLERAVAAWRKAGTRSGLARSLTYLGLALGDLNDPVSARAVGEEAVAVSGEADDWTRAMALWALGANHVLGLVEGADGNSAKPLLEESAALFRDIGDAWGLGAPTYYLSRIAFAAGDLTRASVGLSEAIESMRTIGDKWRLSDGLIWAGEIAVRLGNPAEAKTLFEEAVPLLEDIGSQEKVRDVLARIAQIRI